MPKIYSVKRAERRVPMEVGVQISGNPQVPGVETTFTEDVSGCGARVVTIRRWHSGDRLKITSLPGDFEATARVAYCQSLRGEGFAIGLQFLEHAGRWVVPSAGPGTSLNG